MWSHQYKVILLGTINWQLIIATSQRSKQAFALTFTVMDKLQLLVARMYSPATHWNSGGSRREVEPRHTDRKTSNQTSNPPAVESILLLHGAIRRNMVSLEKVHVTCDAVNSIFPVHEMWNIASHELLQTSNPGCPGRRVWISSKHKVSSECP